MSHYRSILFTILLLIQATVICSQSAADKYIYFLKNENLVSREANISNLIVAANAYRTIGDINTYSFLIIESAYSWMDANEFHKTDSLLNSALHVVSPKKEIYDYPYYRLNYAKALNFSNWLIPDSSEKYWNEALKYVPNEGDKAAILSAKAYLLRYKLKNEEAKPLYQKAIKIYEALTPAFKEKLSSTYNNLAIVYATSGEFTKAIETYQFALQVLLDDCNEVSQLTAQIKHNIAINYLNTGDYDKAERIFKEVVSETKDDQELAKVYFLSKDQLGSLYRNKGSNKRALKIYLEIIDEMKAVEDQPSSQLANAHMKVGLLYQKEGDEERALEYFQIADKLLDSYKDAPSMPVGFLYSYMASSYLHRGDYQKAFDYYRREFNIFSKMMGKDHPNMSFRYLNLGRTYEALADLDSAEYYFTKAWDIQKAQVGKIPFLNLAIARVGAFYIRQQEWQKAIDILSEGYSIFKEHTAKGKFEGNILYLLAYAELPLDPDKALAYSNELAQIYKESKQGFLSNELKYNHYALRGRILEKLYHQSGDNNNLAEAFEAYSMALSALEEYRLQFNSDKKDELIAMKGSELYENILNISAQLYDKTQDDRYIETAFHVSELNKAAALMEAVKSSADKIRLGIPQKILYLERSLSNEIHFYKEKLYEAEADDDSIKIALYRQKLFKLNHYNDKLNDHLGDKYPGYSEMIYKRNTASIRETGSALSKNEILLEYFTGKENIYIIAIQDNELKFQAIPKDNIYELAKDFLDQLRSPAALSGKGGKGDAENAGFVLYEKLLQPFITEDIKKIIIVPDKILAQLPFEALVDEHQNYLLQEYTIAYSYSASFRNSFHQSISNSNKNVFAGFAYSSGNYTASLDDISDNYAALPFAENEVKQIAAILDGQVFIKTEATKSNFIKRSGDYNIIHLSLHGEVDQQIPLASKLIFNETTFDHELKAGEVLNLPINAEMVVLSACNSGSGTFKEGEGVMHLARSFAYAGCKSMVMSLWQVSDRASSQILMEFYRNIKKGFTKDKALQQAKINYLNSVNDPLLKHPFYWASLVPIGNMDSIIFQNNQEECNSPLKLSGIAALIFLLFFLSLSFQFYLIRKTLY